MRTGVSAYFFAISGDAMTTAAAPSVLGQHCRSVIGSAIIREASTSVTADVMTDVRSTSERADDAVANAVNRFLRRRGAAAIEAAPDEEGPR